MPLFCPSCDASNPRGTWYCTACGDALTEDPTDVGSARQRGGSRARGAAERPSRVPVFEDFGENAAKNRKIGILVVLIAVGTAAIALVVWL
jgi:hypothetical protein